MCCSKSCGRRLFAGLQFRFYCGKKIPPMPRKASLLLQRVLFRCSYYSVSFLYFDGHLVRTLSARKKFFLPENLPITTSSCACSKFAGLASEDQAFIRSPLSSTIVKAYPLLSVQAGTPSPLFPITCTYLSGWDRA